MNNSEFTIINQFFINCGILREDCLLGIGDDAAILSVPNGKELVATQDTLVAGVHFFSNTDPYNLGHKALAVNLSDLAAMGADPAWFTLGLTIPTVDWTWLQQFTDGMCHLARITGIKLVGGDTTCGPLSISITALGTIPSGQALRRSGAKPGDDIYISGIIGQAGLALHKLVRGEQIAEELRIYLERPMPRLSLGQALRGMAHAAIDISDGLAADLGHILNRSSVGAELYLAMLPSSKILATNLTVDYAVTSLITAGDDYELCFTIAPNRYQELITATATLDYPITKIGIITAQPGFRIYDNNGKEIILNQLGYEHFT